MEASHETNWDMLKGLFPKWDPNHHEARLFRRAFGSRRADLMQRAIEDFRTYFKYAQPNLGGILKEYGRIHGDLTRANSSRPAVADFDEEADAEEVRKSRARIMLDLEMMDDESMGSVKSAMSAQEVLSGIIGRTRGPVQGWTDTARGLVWAKAIEMGLIAGSSSSTQPPSLSPDPE